MPSNGSFRASSYWCVAGLLAAALCLAGCRKIDRSDTQALYKSGMWSDTIQQLQDLDVSESEVNELIKAHDAGLSDNGCVAMIKLMRGRKEMFSSGDTIANLLHAGVAESTVLELADLDQIGPWTGEAQGIRLSGFSDQIVLAIAQRRAKHLPTVSGASLVQLKNTGVDEPKALDLISRGLTDEQAGQIIAAHQQTEMPQGFVRKTKKKR